MANEASKQTRCRDRRPAERLTRLWRLLQWYRQRLDNGGAHIWRLKDGKAVEFTAMAADQYAQDDFWS